MTQYVGLDLSLTSTGLAMFYPDGNNDVYTTLVPSKPKATGPAVEKRGKLVRTETYADKLRRFQAIAAVIRDQIAYGATVYIEGPSYASVGQATHDIAGSWWNTYRMLSEEMGCLVHVIAPSIVKQYATGKGNAAKDVVMAAVIKRYPDIDILNNDVADATALLALGLRLNGLPLEDDLPATHLKALEKLTA